MDYSLAKELQDAGWKYKDGSRAVGEFAQPTLEELIEACGEDFQKLETIVGDKWQGVGGAGIRDIEVEGNTPSEAVARLWLALNKK